MDSEISLSPMRPSYRAASMFPRCQSRQIGLPSVSLPPAEISSVGSLLTDSRWTGVNPLYGMWSDPMGLEYMQQQGLAQLLSGDYLMQAITTLPSKPRHPQILWLMLLHLSVPCDENFLYHMMHTSFVH